MPSNVDISSDSPATEHCTSDDDSIDAAPVVKCIVDSIIESLASTHVQDDAEIKREMSPLSDASQSDKKVRRPRRRRRRSRIRSVSSCSSEASLYSVSSTSASSDKSGDELCDAEAVSAEVDIKVTSVDTKDERIPSGDTPTSDAEVVQKSSPVDWRKDPQIIPRSIVYFKHDDRLDGDDADINIGRTHRNQHQRVSGRGRGVRGGRAIGKWSHDRYKEEEQRPLTQHELIAKYGYDIRQDERPPEQQRQYSRKRQSRGRRRRQPPPKTKSNHPSRVVPLSSPNFTNGERNSTECLEVASESVTQALPTGPFSHDKAVNSAHKLQPESSVRYSNRIRSSMASRTDDHRQHRAVYFYPSNNTIDIQNVGPSTPDYIANGAAKSTQLTFFPSGQMYNQQLQAPPSLLTAYAPPNNTVMLGTETPPRGTHGVYTTNDQLVFTPHSDAALMQSHYYAMNSGPVIRNGYVG